MKTRLRIAGVHMDALRSHLLPGDGKEAVAFAVCGRLGGPEVTWLLVQRIIPVPYADCVIRRHDIVTWNTDVLVPLLGEIRTTGASLVKFHSHPTDWNDFSRSDDASDVSVFDTVHLWSRRAVPHASVVVMGNGSLFGRTVGPHGDFAALDRIAVAGMSVEFHDIPPGSAALVDRSTGHRSAVPEFSASSAQVLGPATVALLGKLRIGIVGCSGTGSKVVLELARNGVGSLVLVDPDVVEERNLNRIEGSVREDCGRAKVDVLSNAVARMGLGTDVVTVQRYLASAEAVRTLATCDWVFGCMDSHDGRRTLNRLASFYVIPYVDVGVSITPDGFGSIESAVAAAHFVEPGGSSLASRGAISADVANAEALMLANPEEYGRQRRAGYVEGVAGPRPAVGPFNSLAANLGVIELLDRVHRLRRTTRAAETLRLDITNSFILPERHADACDALGRVLGLGDIDPLLDMPSVT